MEIKEVAKLPAVSTLDSECYGFGEDDTDLIYNYTLLGALPTIVFYSGLGEQLKTTKDFLIAQKKKMEDEGHYACISGPDELYGSDSEGNSTKEFSQFEIFWMLLVLMFGGYDASPSSGWINPDQVEDAVLFIDWLLEKVIREKYSCSKCKEEPTKAHIRVGDAHVMAIGCEEHLKELIEIYRKGLECAA